MRAVNESKSMSLAEVYKLIDDKQFKQAFPFVLDIKNGADKGDAAAQYYLGVLLISNKEDKEGGRYLRLAVDQNYLPAIKACLRNRLITGFKNVKEANSILLRKLMEAGDDNAKCVYAWFNLIDRLKLEGDYIANCEYFRSYFKKLFDERVFNVCRDVFIMLYEAALNGNTLSLYMLSRIYSVGLSVNIIENVRYYGAQEQLKTQKELIPRNIDHAHELLVRGANAGDVMCLLKLRGYSAAEDLRLLQIARSKYNKLTWDEMSYHFNVRKISWIEVVELKDPEKIKKIESVRPGTIKKFEYTGVDNYESFFPNSCSICEKDIWDYIVGNSSELPRRYIGIAPSLLMQSGVTGVVDATSLPAFLTDDYEKFVAEVKKEQAEQHAERLRKEASTEPKKKQSEWNENEANRQKGAKNNKGEVLKSPKKRWKFVVLGLLFGFFGIHLAYAKRWLLFFLLWAGFITGNVMAPTKSTTEEKTDETVAQQVEPADKAKKDGGSPISGIGFGVWALLWIGGTLFIKKDGKGNRM